MSTPQPPDDPYLALVALVGETRAGLASLTASAAEMRGSTNSAILGMHERQAETERQVREAQRQQYERDRALSERLARLEMGRPAQRDWFDVAIVLLLAVIAGGIWIGVAL